MGRSGPESQDSVVRSAATSDAERLAFRAAVLGLVLANLLLLLLPLAQWLRQGPALPDLATLLHELFTLRPSALLLLGLFALVFGAPAAVLSIGAAAIAHSLRRYARPGAWRTWVSLIGVAGGCGTALLYDAARDAVQLCPPPSAEYEMVIVIGVALGAVWGVVAPSVLFGAR